MNHLQKRHTLWLTLFAAIGGVLYGYDLGIIAPALLFIKRDIPMTTLQTSIMGGAVFGGGAFSTLFSGFLADRFGRKNMITASGMIFCIGVLLVVVTNTYTGLFLGRLIQGIGVGIVTIVVPLYIAESVPPKVRGRAMTSFQLFLTAAILAAAMAGIFWSEDGNWRAMFLSALVPGILLFIGSFTLPQSPRWLAMHGRPEEALAILKLSRSSGAAKQELERMQQLMEMEKIRATNKIRIQPHHLLPLIIVLVVSCLQQLTGINSLLQFGPTILKAVGMKSNFMAILSGSYVTGLNFITTLIAIFLIDRVGRRALLLIGTAGIAIACFYCAAVFNYVPAGPDKGLYLLCGFMAFIFFYAMGPGVTIWLIISELLPDAIRSWGMAVALFLNSLVSFLFSSVYLEIAQRSSYETLFCICGIASLIYFIIAKKYIPEAKNKTLEEIEMYFREQSQQS